MANDQLIPILMFVTLGAGLAVAVWQLTIFLRSRRNRDIMKNVVKD